MTLQAPDSTDTRWQAVLARDAAAGDAFVYAVQSTGIFCRPTCPSRRPARHLVRFYATTTDALAAGFRACRRCHPTNAAHGTSPHALVERVTQEISEREGRITLAELAAKTGTTRDKLQRAFTRTLGVSPQRYAEAVRLGRLRNLLKDGRPVTRAQFDAGFTSSSRLYERVHERLGMTPAKYQKGAPGIAVRYAVAACPEPLGRLLVAATDRGLCAVRLGGNDKALAADLKHEFHAADISRDEGTLQPWVDLVVAALSDRTRIADLAALPLDIRATAFQASVWHALRGIPAGETRSYLDVARTIGRPDAPRAVARACATNPLAVVIPCHRVVRGDGALGGYRWGLERKAALLAAESGGA